MKKRITSHKRVQAFVLVAVQLFAIAAVPSDALPLSAVARHHFPGMDTKPACDLAISALVTHASCYQSADGAIDLVVAGSGAPFTYDWSNDGPETPDNDPQDLSGLPAGSYSVTVTDNFGCEQMLTVLVEQPTHIQIAGNVSDVTSIGGNDGYVDITVIGGTPSYTFDWDNDGAETPDNDDEDLYDLVAGDYIVNVTDANNCTATAIFTVDEPLVFDLALRKTLATGQPYHVQPGDDVTFTVTVFNQGQLTATNVLVIDYLPAHTTFSAAQNPGWVNFGAGPTLFIPSLQPGASFTKNIKLKVSLFAPSGVIKNYAEISAADDADPNTIDPPKDIDSKPNAFQFDDPGGLPGSPADDVITGNGTGAPGSNDPLTDEDDHDGAAVLVVIPSLSLGNLVFHDADNDGVFNNADSGLPNVEVEIYAAGPDQLPGTADDQFVSSQFTNAFGEYLFTGLGAGFYFVKLTGVGIPTGYVSSTGNGIYDADGDGPYEPAIGTDFNEDDTDDGTQMGVMILSETIQLAFGNEPDGDDNYTVDFGLYEPQPLPTLSLGNLVFWDKDNDGSFNNADVGIEDVEVELYDAGPDQILGTSDDLFVDHQLTNSLGEYLFTGLSEGFYFVVLNGFGLPFGFVSSTGEGIYDNDGVGPYEPATDTDSDEDDTDDGTQIGSAVQSGVIELILGGEPEGNENHTVDFGLYKPTPLASLSLGNLVFFDYNNDGFFNHFDTGIKDVEVELYDAGPDQTLGTADDQWVGSQLTNGFGEYLFTGLPEGFYYVKLTGNGIHPNYISSTGDGIFDYDGAGPFEPATDTDANEDSSDDGTQMGSMIVSGVVELTFGGEPDDNENYTVDFGLYMPQNTPALSLGNLVFWDKENDGVFNNADIGIPDVQVELYNAGPDQTLGTADDYLIANDVTDDNGEYLFTNLNSGFYFVKLNGNGIPTNFVSSTGGGIFDNDGAGPFEPATGTDLNVDNTDDGTQMGSMILSEVIGLFYGTEPGIEVNLTVDFGLFEPLPPPASLGNFVWYDNNHNGQQDFNEPGVEGVLVNLISTGADGLKGGGDDDIFDSQTTSSTGIYYFQNIPTGSYYVHFDLISLPPNYYPTLQNHGDDLTDSDADAMGMTAVFTLLAGEVNVNIDFGIEPAPSNLGNFVWIDWDGNGIQDVGEPGVEGVQVNLFGLGNDGVQSHDDNQIATVTTDANGQYSFTDLNPGNYYIAFDLTTLPQGFGPTAKDAGNEDDDSDANPSGQTDIIVLGAGEINNSVDMGIFSTNYDLALTKTLSPGQPTQVNIGDQIAYTITVTNEGDNPVYQIKIVDYIPAGLFLSPGNPGWVTLEPNTVGHTIAGPLWSGQSESVEIWMTVHYDAIGPTLVNMAEVNRVEDINGNEVTDFDSTPDNAEPGEDDMDEVEIELLPHDPTGWVYCDKTGKIITGGTIIVTGPNGIPNDQVDIIHDGSDGYFEFYTDGTPGVYNLTFSHPDGYPLSANCADQAGPFDPTGLPNPVVFGGDTLNSMFLADPTCASNPYYLSFDIEPGDPNINLNNLPLSCVFISATVCDDTNLNDAADAGDTPQVGATVYLYDCADLTTSIAATVTDSVGRYQFDGLLAGDYVVGFPSAPNLRFVSSGNINQNGFSDCMTLAWGECDTTKTICIYPCPTINLGPDIDHCSNTNSSLLDANLSHGTGSYSWTPAAGLSNAAIQNPVAAPAVTTNYVVSFNDGFGCLASDTILVNVGTSSPYLINMPFTELSVECAPIPSETPVFADDCDANLTILADTVTTLLPCGFVQEITWTATNDEGNTASFTQTLSVNDTLPPTMTANHAFFGAILHGDTLYADCTQIPTLDSIGFSAFDNCGAATVTFSENITSGHCPTDGFYEVRHCGWTATDACGNLDSLFFTVIIYDNQPPVMTANHAFFGAILDGDTLFADCTQIPSLDSIGFSAFDNCGATTVTFSENITSGHCPTDGFYEVRHCGWTATDVCGNLDSLFFTVIIYDNQPPIMTANHAFFGAILDGDTLYADCSMIPALDSIGFGAYDNCSATTVTFTENISSGHCPTDGFYEVRHCGWTATDACGNVDSLFFTVIIYDNLPPIISPAPGDVTVSCSAIPLPAILSATDNCDDTPTLTLTEIESIDSNGCITQIIRIWTAEDDCGNSAVALQTIIVLDNTTPTLVGVPANLSLDCTAAIPTAPTVSATDACDPNVPVSLQESTIGDPVTGCITITRTWSATDNCGNTATASQTITITDTTPPILAGIPADLTLNCWTPIPAPATVTASDFCDSNVPAILTQSYIGDPTTGCFTLVRTWTATDDCGNAATASQNIVVFDNSGPVLAGVPADLTLDCATPVPAPPTVTATDNCAAIGTVNYNQNINGNPATGCFVVTRTWSATDNCGNTTSATQTITVQDNIAPILSATPADLSLNCVSAIPAAPTITATDNCDTNVPVLFFQAYTGNPLGCNYQLLRTWAAADDCGNVTAWTQTITVNDTIAPVLGAVPANVVIACGSPVPLPPVVTATDNCDANVDVTMTATYLGDPTAGCYLLTRTWTATDDCGNTDSKSQLIQVIDTQAPNFVGLPANGVAACDNLPGANVTATDNCDPNVTITISDQIQSSVFGCVTQVVRTWTAADDCGNIRIASRTFTLSNTDAPVITIVEPAMAGVQDGDVLFMECGDLVPISAASVTATADCCGAPTITFYETVAGANCQTDGYLAIMHCGWIATDCCGNSDSLFFTVYVIDNTPPTFYGVPGNLVLPVGSPLPALPVVYPVDNCDHSIPVSYNTTTTGPPNNQLTTRTWSAVDDCGNIAIAVQTILITNDITAPILYNVPADVTIEGPVSDLPGDFGVTATDDLDEHPEIAFVEDRTGGICCYVITRTWTATDDFGNSSSATQTITVTDTQSPVITGTVADVTGTCSLGAVPIPQITATDNCTDLLTLSFTADTTQLACGYHILRTWAFTDECDNTAIAQQNITVEDTEAPVFDPSNELAIYFFASQNATSNGGVSLAVGAKITANQTWSIGNQTMPSLLGVATDNCSAPDQIGFRVANILEVSSGCERSYLVVFEVLDACGNVSPDHFTVTVGFEDDHAPSFANLPQDLTVTCGNVPVPAVLSASDDSGYVNVAFDEVQVPGCPLTITRIWTATDGCGNSTIAEQKITVTDNVAPAITNVPANILASCENIPSVPTNVLATDNCSGSLSVAFSETISGGNCQYTITRTWSASDACGNSAIKQQYIWVADNKAPTIANYPLANLTVSCDEALPPVPSITVSDNCDDSPTVDLVETVLPGPNNCSYSVRRTWTVTDFCGNSAIAEQIIKVTDNTLPTIANIPADITVNCGGIPTASAILASDNCDTDVEVIFKETVVPSPSGCPSNIVRNWIAVDNCSNQAEATQTITVVDYEPPVLSAAPANLSVTCGTDVPAPAQLTATDNCGLPVTVTMSETLLGATGICDKTILRTWTATDACGNTATASQTIEVNDAAPPVLVAAPANLALTCGDPIPVPATLVATDNCTANVEVVLVETMNATACGQDILRTWTATDDCGNTSTVSQTITLTDHTAPTATEPQDLTVNCGELPTPITPVFVDDCDQNLTVQFTEIATQVACGQNLLRTWTATDHCGNSTVVDQLIYVTDLTGPVLTFANPVLAGYTNGDTMILSCANNLVFNALDVLAADDCSNVNVQMDMSGFHYGDCLSDGYIVAAKFRWTATDDCGNASTLVLNVRVEDNEAPVFPNLPNLVVNCGEAVPTFATPSVLDDCGEVTLDFASQNFTTSFGHNVVGTWTATDNCGNTATSTQTVQVYSIGAAQLVGVPADVTIDLSNGGVVPPVASVEAVDNCSGAALPLIFEENKEVLDGCNSVIERRWLAVGQNGSTVTETQTITVTDVVQFAATMTADSCNSSNGSVLLTPSTLDFVWGNGAVGALQIGLSAGYYTVTATNANGCSATMNVSVAMACNCSPAIVKEIRKNTTKCGGNNGKAVIHLIQQSVTDYHFTWSPDLGQPSISGHARTYLPAGHYEVTISAKSLAGCVTVVSFDMDDECPDCGPIFSDAEEMFGPQQSVTEVCLPVPFGMVADHEIMVGGQLFDGMLEPCSPHPVTLYGYAGLPTGGNYSVTWLHDGATFHTLVNNLYELAAAMNAVDPHGHWFNDSAAKELVTTKVYGNYGLLSIRQNSTGIVTSIGAVSTTSNTGTLLTLPAGKHVVSVSNSVTGCSDELLVNIADEEVAVVREEELPEEGTMPPGIMVFNGFSPNGDGKNDYFRIDGLALYPQHELKIYNSSGKIVFITGNYRSDWGGSWGQNNLPNGTYYYLLEDGKGKAYTGYVQIQR